MARTVSEVVARPIRTAAQATPSWIITEFVDAWIYDMSERQFAATVLLLTMVAAYAQAAIENAAGRGWLRAVPPRTVPVVEPETPVEDPDGDDLDGDPFEYEDVDPAANDGLPQEPGNHLGVKDIYGKDARG